MSSTLKRIGIGIIGLLIVVIVLVFGISTVRWNSDYHDFDVSVEPIAIPDDEQSIARGEHIAFTHYCRSCHGANLEGDYLLNDRIVAVVPAPNLTSGEGGLGSNTDEDWIRAIRHGIGHDGRSLIGMPSWVWSAMNDEDLGALIGYLKTLPPVDNELPQRQIGPMIRVAIVLGQAPTSNALVIDHDAPRLAPVEPAATVEYGAYLSYMCTSCHGVDFSGGTIRDLDGSLITALNLTPGGELKDWSEEDFITAVRTGRTPDGRQLSSAMPWPYFGQMTDDEVQAIWLYLQTVPAREQNLERTDL